MIASARRPLYGVVSAALISILGTAMSALAIPWLVLVETGSAGKTGAVGFAEMAPYVLLQATAGPLVDRVGARRASMLGNAVAAVLVAAIPALHAANMLHLGVLMALVAAAGAVRGLADSATSPMVPATAKLGDVPLERAAGLYSGAARLGQLIGAPSAGVLITVFGAPSVLIVDAISFAVAAAIVAATVPPTGVLGPGSATRLNFATYVGQLSEGFRFLRRDRLLLNIVILVAVTNMLDQALSSVLLPVWARDRLHSAAGLGAVSAVMGLGALAGVIIATALGPRLPRRATIGLGFFLGGAPRYFVLAIAATLSPVLAVTLAAEVLGGVINPLLGAVEYERIPPQLHARVLGAIKASAWVTIPFGSLLGGALVNLVGLTSALTLCGAVYLVVTVTPLILPAWRDVQAPVPVAVA
jgi:MFS family permease